MRLRSRKKHHDGHAAVTYFRHMVEAHALNALDSKKILSAIGIETNRNPLFEHSLRLIPQSDLEDIVWDRSIGDGLNGSVYKATWKGSHGRLATSRYGVPNVSVVLKDVVDPSQPSDAFSKRQKLLREVRNTRIP